MSLVATMPLPLYGFLEGDTIGLLILADENESIASLARKLQEAGNIRVRPSPEVQLVYQGKIIDSALSVSDAGFTALERFDVRQP
jgi:Toluene-4-monooxygenase system protein B (TmoB)